jgi:hypothetical protein
VAPPVRLLQIEEPGGGPTDPDLPAAAIGIDASGAVVEAAFAVGGNAVRLQDRAEFARISKVPAVAAEAEWRVLFEAVRLRAERVLSRTVSHAVVVLSATPGGAEPMLRSAAAGAGIEILRLASAAEFSDRESPLLAAAILAEELLPRSGTESARAGYFR